jgi:hypothetical protein
MAADGIETLTDLVASTLQPQGRDTLDTLFPRCVDPESKRKLSRTTVWKLSRPDLALSVKVAPDVVRAVAAGLGLPVDRVQAAAAYQFTGFVSTATERGVIVHMPGVDASEAPKSRAVLDRWDEEES